MDEAGERSGCSKKKVAASNAKTDDRFRDLIEIEKEIEGAVAKWFDEVEPVDTSVFCSDDNAEIVVSLGDSVDDCEEVTDKLRVHLAGLVERVTHCDECGKPDGFRTVPCSGKNAGSHQAVHLAYQQQKGPLDGPAVSTNWNCPGCGAVRGPHENSCPTCHHPRGDAKDKTSLNRAPKPGETPPNYMPPAAPAAVQVQRGVAVPAANPVPVGFQPTNFVGRAPTGNKNRKRAASAKVAGVPVDDKEHKHEEEERIEDEEVEFKQMLAPGVPQHAPVQHRRHDPIATLRGAIREKDDRTNSFNALAGDPAF